ncbi:MAG: hypothetical protein HY320_07905 [Armatimonadetes bacterium]|nr:hypothetical protein [Armatimonadota bacterium]
MTSPFSFGGAVIWLGALATLALYSVLYRENPIYRFAEHIFLGLATAMGLYMTWKTVLYPTWYKELVAGHWAWILTLVAGGMYYTIYSKRLVWMSRLVMMTMMGLSAGLGFRGFFGTYMKQIGASFKPLVVMQHTAAGGVDVGGSVFASFTNILFLATMVCVMTYFFFSFEQKNRPIRRTASAGRWLMMIAFGAMFGSTVMARLSLFIGRLTFLFQDWIHLIRS